MLGERRMALLRDTAVAHRRRRSRRPSCSRALERALAGSTDLPFTLTYLLDEAGSAGALACRTGIAADHPAAVRRSSRLADRRAVAAARGADRPGGCASSNSTAVSAICRPGRGPRPPTHALVLPDRTAGAEAVRRACSSPASIRSGRSTMRIAASSSLLVGQIAAGLANVHAYEEERRRAEALAEIDRAKTTFFSNVSHEFRTPLTLLLGPLDDALRDTSDAAAARRTGISSMLAHRNSLRLLKLVNTLLDFSRIEAGRVRARFEPVDLGALTADLASTFRSAMDEAGLDFRVDCRRRSPSRSTSIARCGRRSSSTSSPTRSSSRCTGRVAVTVSTRDERALLDGGRHRRRHSRSTSCRASSSASTASKATQGRSHEGSGIGLALVQELVKLHGGELSAAERGRARQPLHGVDSARHRASAARADRGRPAAAGHRERRAPYVEEALRWLPRRDAERRARDSAREPQPPASPAADIGRVLLADDNADMRDYAHGCWRERWQRRRGQQRPRGAARPRARGARRDRHRRDDAGARRLRPAAGAARRSGPAARSRSIMLSARAGEEARSRGWRRRPTTIWSSRSRRAICSRGSTRRCVKARARAIEQQHAQRLTQLFTHAPVAIAVLRGPDHVYELANPRYRELVGGRDVVGKPIREALPELDGQGIYRAARPRARIAASRTSATRCASSLNRGPNGERGGRATSTSSTSRSSRTTARVETIVVIAHDVTALAIAKHEAETANRLKDEFLATLSHELRTPLNAVLGYTQMLRGGVIDAERLPAVLETIERNARLQEQLISDVLDVSRIITGKLRLDVGPVDLTRVIQDALETVAPAAAAKGVRLQSAIDQPGVPVAGDAQRLQQVVWNLLSNADQVHAARRPRAGSARSA